MAVEQGGQHAGEDTSLPMASEPLLPPPPPFAPSPILSSSGVTGRRIAAGLIDLVPLTFLAVAMGDRTASNGRFNVNLSGIKVLWWLLAVLAYGAIAELITRTTPGKALVGLCVRNDDGRPASLQQILTRNALR